MADPRDLIQRLLTVLGEDYVGTPLEVEAQAYIATPEPAADGPAVPDGREPASVVNEPTDAQLLELMPEAMRDEFSYAATVCSEATGGQVKPGIFRVCLNTAALEYARAVLARWGHQPPRPIPLSERLPGPEDCDGDCCIWLWVPDINGHVGLGHWERQHRDWATDPDGDATHWLPYHVLPLPETHGQS